MIICLFVYSVIQEINLFSQQGRFKLIKSDRNPFLGYKIFILQINAIPLNFHKKKKSIMICKKNIKQHVYLTSIIYFFLSIESAY